MSNELLIKYGKNKSKKFYLNNKEIVNPESFEITQTNNFNTIGGENEVVIKLKNCNIKYALTDELFGLEDSFKEELNLFMEELKEAIA